MVLVDAPDLDSTSTRHRAMAERLIDDADIVIFVTSALRYADEVPWQVLRRATSRGTPVINVLNRVGSAAAGAIVDFKSRLAAEGLDDGLTTVPEHHLAGAGQVPPLAVRSLRRRLRAVVSDHEVFAREVFARVLRSTVTQIEDLLGAIAGIQDEIDGLEAEISLDLVTRVSQLGLDGIAIDLYPNPPDRRGALALRRWKAGARRDESGVAEAEESVVERLVAAVEADVRRWLVAERESLRQHGVDHRRVLDGARTVGRSAAEGWIEFVARIAADHDERDLWLCEAVLLEAAVSESLPEAASLLFGDESAALVERARRDLTGRLEVVYEQVATRVAEHLRGLHGDIDDTELVASLGAAIGTFAPIYA
jgi:hypothetical protein